MIFGRRDPLADPEPLIRRVYAYVAYVVGSGPDAEDLTSDAIERAVRYRDSYDPAKGTPSAWLIGIARRCIADRHGEPEPLPDDLFEHIPDPHGDVTEAIDRLSVQAAVATLGPRDRELIALRYGADLTTRQIGELLGLQPNAVDVALHRALARLRDALAADFAA
jgi:RNA polymerase sigma-70 factor (ECF subfamily)